LTTLRNVGIEPEVKVSGVDEDAALAAATAQRGPLTPADTALTLACAKAEAVPVDDALVLGCDSILELDGEIHGKPASAAEATERWHRMRGQSGILHTGHWLIDRREGNAARAVGSTSSTVVHFADLSDDEIAAYVATGEPLKVAGAFTIDGLGGAFVDGLEGDHHTVVGLSLPLLRQLLGELGIAWPELWDSPPGSGGLTDT
jgi:septum formation protein